MKVPQPNRNHLIPILLLFFCSILTRMNTKGLEAATLRNKFSQATIPATPNDNAADFCANHWRFDRYPIAAATLGMAHDALWVALHDDKSIADFAQSRQIEVQLVIEAIVNAETAHIHTLVQQSCLSQATAEAKLAALPNAVTTFVHDQTAPALLMCRVGWPDYAELTATILAMDSNAFYQALSHGHSPVSLAAARGLSRLQLIDALLEAKLAVIQGLVETHCVAESDGALWRQLIPLEVTDFVDNGVDAETMRNWIELTKTQPQRFYLPLLMN